MHYDNIVKAKFIRRENRFTAQVFIEGQGGVKAHVKNTGRCREIFVEGAAVYLQDHAEKMDQRKLRYSLIAVEKETERGRLMVNADSQAPNKVVKEALEQKALQLPGLMGNIRLIRPEKTFGTSRFDLYIETDREEKAFIEVKGVTLEEGGHARFPDAPTLRGVKHLEELAEAHRAGYHTYVLFIIQMNGMDTFSPNWETHREFGEGLVQAHKQGVHVLAYDCAVTPDSLKLNGEVAVKWQI